eukprot:7308243-Prymnesium_polylepis.1
MDYFADGQETGAHGSLVPPPDAFTDDPPPPELGVELVGCSICLMPMLPATGCHLLDNANGTHTLSCNPNRPEHCHRYHLTFLISEWEVARLLTYH